MPEFSHLPGAAKNNLVKLFAVFLATTWIFSMKFPRVSLTFTTMSALNLKAE